MPDLVSGYVFTDGEKGITSTKLNNVVGGAVIQTDFVANKPAGSALGMSDQLLSLTSGGSYARITGQMVSDSVASSPSITAMRLRSFNALAYGNCNFEVDQRTAGTGVTMGAGSTFACDRWLAQKAGMSTGTATAVRNNTAVVVSVPGTSFYITAYVLRVTLTAQQSSLAAGDLLWLSQTIEGPLMRELLGDVHSVQILARSSVANLGFGLALRDSPSTKSLTKLCTLGAANTWSLVTLPNLPLWAAGGNWTPGAGSIGYLLSITLAAGSTFMSPANDTWQSGNFTGATGQTNFAGQAVNSTFDLAFVQHEPGSVCTQLMDLDFDTNLSRCQRYFDKSYDNLVKPGTASNTSGAPIWYTGNLALTFIDIPTSFKRRMAKVPTITAYSPVTGAAATLRNYTTNADVAVSSTAAGETGIISHNVGSSVAATSRLSYHWTADTGW